VAATERRRYGGQSAEQRDDERRRKLRESALELFGTEGYTSVTVERVCAAAKVSTRHYYQLYRNKEDLLVDTYSALTAEAFQAATGSLAHNADEPMAVRLPAAISAYLAPILADARAARLAFVEIVGVSGRVEDTRLQYRDAIIALIEQEGAAAVGRGEITPRDFRFLGLAFLGAVNVVVHDWSLHSEQRAHELGADLERQLCALAVDLMTGERPLA
jgi:AcrR family transcriptional regulator